MASSARSQSNSAKIRLLPRFRSTTPATRSLKSYPWPRHEQREGIGLVPRSIFDPVPQGGDFFLHLFIRVTGAPRLALGSHDNLQKNRLRLKEIIRWFIPVKKVNLRYYLIVKSPGLIPLRCFPSPIGGGS